MEKLIATIKESSNESLVVAKLLIEQEIAKRLINSNFTPKKSPIKKEKGKQKDGEKVFRFERKKPNIDGPLKSPRTRKFNVTERDFHYDHFNSKEKPIEPPIRTPLQEIVLRKMLDSHLTCLQRVRFGDGRDVQMYEYTMSLIEQALDQGIYADWRV